MNKTPNGKALKEGLSVRVQSILYKTSSDRVLRSLEYLDNAVLQARKIGAAARVEIAYGDCSPEPIFDAGRISSLRTRFENLTNISCRWFDDNLGSAGGHNRLLLDCSSDLVMIMNPDVLLAPNVLVELIGALARPDVGFVEARQLPIEHPKDYDPITGETSWASTACAMASGGLFRKLGGFDDASFFLYCDDVDFSWRVRLQGYKVVQQCSAVVFHDKRLTAEGGWISTPAEQYYSAESALLLTYKYSRSDLTDHYLNIFTHSDVEHLQRAAAAFRLRKQTGRLPVPLDKDHRVAEFIDGAYAQHRFRTR